MIAACSKPPSTASYPQPNNDQAESSYEDSFSKDFLEERPAGQGANDEIQSAPVRQAYGMMNSESDEKARARMRIRDTEKVEVRLCQWQDIDLANVGFQSRWRVRDKVDAGYYCEIKVYQNFHSGGVKSDITNGYFYKSGDNYEYAGETAKNF